MSTVVTLSTAKAHLSEVVRAVRTSGEEAVITVDGEPAARLVPVAAGPRPLTSGEVATLRALMSSLRRVGRQPADFDAVDLVGEGRR